MLPYPRKQKVFARNLRRTQTDAEKKLWSKLRDRQLSGIKFRRQHAIGKYIADFCCVESKLVIELDGSQHAQQSLADELRSHYLRQSGFCVLRFWDNDVLTKIDAVIEQIVGVLEGPHPNPLPKGEGTGRDERG